MWLDPLQPFLDDHPQEWERVPEKYRKHLVVVRGMASRQQTNMLRAIAASRWFLIRNEFYDRNGKRLRRKGSNIVDEYLTLAGIERPWNGLDECVALFRKADGELVDGASLFGVDDGREWVEIEITGQRIGQIVPITREKAYYLIREIRARGEPLYPELSI